MLIFTLEVLLSKNIFSLWLHLYIFDNFTLETRMNKLTIIYTK